MAIKEHIEKFLTRLDETRVPSNEELTAEDHRAELGVLICEHLTCGEIRERTDGNPKISTLG